MKKQVIALVCTAALLAGCGTSASTPGTYTVTLEGNGTTGYEWTYTMSEEGIVKETAADSKYEGSDGMTGAPSTYTWTFEALKEGTVTLTYEYARSWETVEPAETNTYTLTVDKDLQISAVVSTAAPSTALPDVSPEAASLADGEGILCEINGGIISFSGGFTTGYDWSSYFISDDAEDIVSISDYDFSKGNSQMNVDGATYNYTVTGLKAGTAEIGFLYSDVSDGTIGNNYRIKCTVADDLSVTCEDITNTPDYSIDGNVITLAGNPTTGYDWTAYYVTAADEDYLSISDAEYTSDSTDRDGAGGIYQFTLTGKQAGTANIGFSYHQSFTADSLVYDIQFACTIGSDLSVSCEKLN